MSVDAVILKVALVEVCRAGFWLDVALPWNELRKGRGEALRPPRIHRVVVPDTPSGLERELRGRISRI